MVRVPKHPPPPLAEAVDGVLMEQGDESVENERISNEGILYLNVYRNEPKTQETVVVPSLYTDGYPGPSIVFTQVTHTLSR